jgi:hypothetical protein
MSFLALEGLHAFVTGAQGGIGQAIVKELLGTSLLHIQHQQIPSRPHRTCPTNPTPQPPAAK